jgi:acetyltransferase (GNAT) family protein
MVTVRRATAADAPAIGRVHVRAWQAAYRGQMPDGYLDGLCPEDRAAYWNSVLAREDFRGRRPGRRTGRRGRRVRGRRPVAGPPGRRRAVRHQPRPGHWGTGAGRALLEAVQVELARLGFAESVLWVLPGNARARRFYEAAGWAFDGTERDSEAFGASFAEVRYRRRSTSEEISSATPVGTE